MKLNDLVSTGELKTDMVAMACGKFRDDSAPLKFTDVDGSIAQCPLVPVIDVLGVRVSHDGNSQVALFHRLAMATRLFCAKSALLLSINMWLLVCYLDQVDGHYHKVCMIACDPGNCVPCGKYLAASADLVRLMWTTFVGRMHIFVPG